MLIILFIFVFLYEDNKVYTKLHKKELTKILISSFNVFSWLTLSYFMLGFLYNLTLYRSSNSSMLGFLYNLTRYRSSNSSMLLLL